MNTSIDNVIHPGPVEKRNITALDGLRAFAALGVVTLHITYLIGHSIFNEYKYPWLSFYLVFGNTGVQLFFVLSGFLLFMPYAKALLWQAKWPSVRNFYFRRALRIAPGYYFSLFMLIIFVQPVYLHRDHWKQLLLFLLFFMDSSKTTFQQIDVPYWSLAVEVQFYLMLPLVALGISAFVAHFAQKIHQRLYMAISACLGIILFGLAIRYIGLQLVQYPPAVSGLWSNLIAGAQFLLFGTWGKYWEDFAVGMIVSLLFIYSQHPQYGQHFYRKLQKISILLGLGAVVLLTICAIWNFRTDYTVDAFNFLLPLVKYCPWLMDFCASVGWGLLVAAIVFDNRLFKAPFEWRPMRWLGMISYSIYLWHMPMLTIFKKYIFSHLNITNIDLSHVIYWLFFAIVIIPWCFLVYWYVERPFLRIKELWGKTNFAIKEVTLLFSRHG